MDLAQNDKRNGMSGFCHLTHENKESWYAVPISGGSRALCREVKLAHPTGWITKMLRKFDQECSKMSGKAIAYAELEHCLMSSREEESFVAWSRNCLAETMAGICDVGERYIPEIVYESQLENHVQLPWRDETPSKRIVRLVKAVGGDAYYTGGDGAKSSSYLKAEDFAHAGIELCFEQFDKEKELGLGDYSYLTTYARLGGEGMLNALVRYQDEMLPDRTRIKPATQLG